MLGGQSNHKSQPTSLYFLRTSIIELYYLHEQWAWNLHSRQSIDIDEREIYSSVDLPTEMMNYL